MFGRKKLQHLKELKRAPQGTLSSRIYLLRLCVVLNLFKPFVFGVKK